MLAQASGDAVAWRSQVAPHSSAGLDTGLILAQSGVTALGAGSHKEASWPFDRTANTEALEGHPRALHASTQAHRPQYQLGPDPSPTGSGSSGCGSRRSVSFLTTA